MIVESYWDSRRYRLECAKENSEIDAIMFDHCFDLVVRCRSCGPNNHLNDSPTNRRLLESVFASHGIVDIKYYQKEKGKR